MHTCVERLKFCTASSVPIYRIYISVHKAFPNLESEIEFQYFFERWNELDTTLTEYFYIIFWSFLHSDYYHVIPYTLLDTFKKILRVGFYDKNCTMYFSTAIGT